jgi:hypothetical protein
VEKYDETSSDLPISGTDACNSTDFGQYVEFELCMYLYRYVIRTLAQLKLSSDKVM